MPPSTDSDTEFLAHSHIDWHLKLSVVCSLSGKVKLIKLTIIFRSGLAVVFAEDIADTPELDEPTGVRLSITLLHLAHVYSYDRGLEISLSNI